MKRHICLQNRYNSQTKLIKEYFLSSQNVQLLIILKLVLIKILIQFHGIAMKKIQIIFVLVYLIVSNSLALADGDQAKILYEINVLNHQDDLFHVTVYTEGLTEENNIYNLPSTVPGTYSVLDFGRFMKSFEAFDIDGNTLPVEQISIDRWEISNSDRLAKLVYDIEDSFDSDIDSNKVLPMGGTGINDDFIVLNTFGVLGYFEGLQSVPSKLKIDYDTSWTVGTSLTKDDEGYYTADTYDYLADNPILMGDLTTASTTVNDIKVGVYVYCPDTSVTAGKVLQVADALLQSSAGFIGYSPVTHYNFLMCLLDPETFQKVGFLGAGALEHSYSSLFVYPVHGNLLAGLQDDMAHEFLHILTPLNLHSNIIEPFNFITPTASEHLWLYEGVTEWASDIMQLRGGLISIEDYLERFSEKINYSGHFRNDISLTELSRDVYSEAITMQFLNIYQKGAITAALLDIRLLELSNGKKGLRDVFLELLDEYGKNKPFPEDEFFDIFIDHTYPEIEQFIDDYIKDTKLLPYEEYMKKLGFKYIAERVSKDTTPVLGVQIGLNEKQQLVIMSVSEETENAGLKTGDIPLKVLGVEVSMSTAREIFGKIHTMKAGDDVDMVVQRGDEEVELNITLQQRMDRDIFENMKDLREEQQMLREAWTKNL